jgi:D-alanyl-D-alanine carboxypeptidase
VHRGNRYVVAVVFGGRTARARDARVESLIAQNFDKASARRGAPADGAQDIPVAKAEPKVEPVKAAAPALAQFKTVDDAQVAHNEVTSIDAPQTGSTAPIKPNLVKTVVVHSGAFRTASLSPPQPESNRLAPAPATARATRVTDIATIKSEVPPLPPPPGARPGVLGTLPAKVASASATVPLPATANESAAKHNGWMIQVGAFDDEKDAKQRLDAAQDKVKLLGKADPFTEKVSKGKKSLYRARFAGLDKDQAETACKHLKHSDIPCMLLKN